MRVRLLSTLLALGLVLAAAAPALAGKGLTGPKAKAHITKRLQYSSKVVDKSKPFTTRLGGKKGDKIRPFTASNIRPMIIPFTGPNGAQGGARIHVGNVVTGTLNMVTGEVRTKGVSAPRSAPQPVQSAPAQAQ